MEISDDMVSYMENVRQQKNSARNFCIGVQ
jgi:hypothetical protein